MNPIKIWRSMDGTNIGLFLDEGLWRCLWKNEDQTGEDEWNEFGGSVGYSCAEFKTRKEALAFVKRGLREEFKNSEVWLDMVAVR